MVQIQSSKSWVFKSRFSFKVRQQHFMLQYRTLSFSTTRLNLQPPLQYPPLIPFLTSAIFHLNISLPHVLPKPSLKSLPTLPLYLRFFSTLYLFIQTLLQSFSIPHSFSQFNQWQGPSEQWSIVRNDTVWIFPCFHETWAEITALTITDHVLFRLKKLLCCRF